MGEQINCILMPSLECGALMETAAVLWNQDDIRDFILADGRIRFVSNRYDNNWQNVENKVKVKVQQLPLPESLKKKVSGFIKPIGFEILKWCKDHENLFLELRYERFVRKSLNKLCWTPQGTIDRKQTIEVLIKDESLDIVERYTFACIYCLENDILTLWSQIPENCRSAVYLSVDSGIDTQEELLLFWTYNINGDVQRIKKLHTCDNYRNAFQYAVYHGNKVAAEYFFQKLTSEEREVCLVESAQLRICSPRRLFFYLEDDTDILYFLLSQMTVEQRLEMSERYPMQVLKSLLDWPRQGSFVGMAKHLWAFLSECGYRPLLFYLFRVKDTKNLKLILENATITDRENIIFSKEGKSICKSLIYDEKMDLLEFFVQQCISSKDVMIKFTEELKEYIVHENSLETLEKKEGMCNKIFQLLNVLTEKYDKRRCAEEGNSGVQQRDFVVPQGSYCL